MYVDSHISRKFDAHVLDDFILEEFEISVEICNLPLDVCIKSSERTVVFEYVFNGICFDLVRGCIESTLFQDLLGALEAPSTFILRVWLATSELRLKEFLDAAVWGTDVLGHQTAPLL